MSTAKLNKPNMYRSGKTKARGKNIISLNLEYKERSTISTFVHLLVIGIQVLSSPYELHQMFNFCFMYPMMLLPTFPWVVWMLTKWFSTSQRDPAKKERTNRPKAWNILSEVPSGLLKKYLASSISSSLLYRIFLSGGTGRGSSPSVLFNSCL